MRPSTGHEGLYTMTKNYRGTIGYQILYISSGDLLFQSATANDSSQPAHGQLAYTFCIWVTENSIYSVFCIGSSIKRKPTKQVLGLL